MACRVLGFSKQAFYARKEAPVTERDFSDAHMINVATDVHRDFTATAPDQLWLTDITEHRTDEGKL